MLDDAVLNRIRAEYLEMPGLRLTLEQAQRLCGVDRRTCQRVFDELVDMGFLCLKANGTYGRITEGIDHLRPQPTKIRPTLAPAHKAS